MHVAYEHILNAYSDLIQQPDKQICVCLARSFLFYPIE